MIQFKLILIFLIFLSTLNSIQCYHSPVDIVTAFLKSIGHRENQEFSDEVVLRKKYDFIIGEE
jgi:hypothetical protein